MAISFSPSSTNQKYLIGSPSDINVIKECAWAVFDGKSMAAGEVPYIKLIEWQPLGDQFLTKPRKFIEQLASGQGAGGGLDAYKDMYRAEKTGNKYTFPYFTSEMRSKTNNWQTDTTLSVPADVLNYANKAISVAVPYVKSVGAGTLGIEYPKIWQGTDVGSTYTFDFYLHNTISEEQTASNWVITYMLSYNNSYNRQNLIVQDAPTLYQVFVPGIRYSPAASMKDLKINMVGQMRTIKGLSSFGLPNEVIIPEAYHVVITMEDLFVESRQMMQLVTQGNAATNVTVFTSK